MKMNYSNNGVTVSLMRDIRKKDSDAECPLKWCITYKRIRSYYSTGKNLNGLDWKLFEESENADFNKKAKALHLKEVKNDLEDYFEKALKPKIKELIDNNSFTLDLLNVQLGKSEVQTLNDAFREKIEFLHSEDRINYADSYKSTLSSIERFKGKAVQFYSITPESLRKYEKYLIGLGRSVTTVGFYMRNIRTVINESEYLKGERYPFGKGKYIIPKGERRELALNLYQIHAIHSYKCEKSIEKYKDLWLFSFYGNGMNMTDICRLRYDEIKDGEITFIRKKTKEKRRTIVRIYVPIVEPMKTIIKKHGNRSKNGYIFPFLNEIPTEIQKVRKISDITKSVNETVQLIAKELKLPEGITTYATRHSYVTILERLNVPRIFIQNSLGHTSESVTDSYSKMAERDLRLKYNSLLLPISENQIIKNLVTMAKVEMILN